MSAKKNPGEPISGSLKPFQTPEYKTHYQTLTGGAPSFNLGFTFRKIVKCMTGDRMHVALSRCNRFAPLPKERIIKILENYDIPKDMTRYVECLIIYYNDSDMCTYHVLQEYCYNKSPLDKAVRHGIEDIRQLLKQVKTVHDKLQTSRSIRERQQELLGKYNSIEDATELFLDILDRMYRKPLPRRLNTSLYDTICKIDPRMANYYSINRNGKRCLRPEYIRKYYLTRYLCIDAAAVLAVHIHFANL